MLTCAVPLKGRLVALRIGARSIPIEYYILRIAAQADPANDADGMVVGYLADHPIFATVAD